MTNNLILTITLFLATYFGSANYAVVNAQATDNMVRLVNEQRQAINVPALVENAQLDASAKAKACDMVNRHYFSHQDPNGKTMWYLITDTGYRGHFVAENLARNLDDKTAMAKFMDSETHRKNILNAKYLEIGIGRCGSYTVQHFGRRYLW